MRMTTRNSDLPELHGILAEQHAAKYDLVVPSTHLSYQEGNLVVDDIGEPVITEDGVTSGDILLAPTGLFEDGIATRLDIPRAYLRRMREAGEETGDWLLDRNVNYWLDRSDRNWFIRGFRWGDETVARAFLSDRYNVIDNIDAFFAVLDGITDAGLPPDSLEISGDLTERKMRVKVTSPSIRAAVPKFLKDYRSPFNGQRGDDLPLVYAGLVVSNSETGGGAFQIAPHITILVCRNGMTRTTDAMRRVHLGERMDQGVISWSAETKRAGVDLIKSQATDAVVTFLSQAYLDEVADELEQAGGRMLAKPMEAVDQLTSRYSEEERSGILDLFVRSGDTSAAGAVQAVTAYAQTVDDADRAAELEESSFAVLQAAVALTR